MCTLRIRTLGVVFFPILLAGCPPHAHVRLLAPPNGSTAASRNVMFQWSVTNIDDPVTCTVFTDKGQNPLDGQFEDQFPAGGANQVAVVLDSLRYTHATFEWAVRCNGTNSEIWRLTIP